MEGFIPDFFRKQSLKRHASTEPTEILPLSRMKSYVAIIDVEDTSYDTCKTQIMNFFRKYDINGSIYFQDFRKIGSEDRLITSIQTTITRKDVNWYGKPSPALLKVMDELHPDLLICLIKNPEYPIEYLVRTSNARFKIGRKQLEGNVFDMVFVEPEDKRIQQLESFNAMKNFLLKIQ